MNLIDAKQALNKVFEREPIPAFTEGAYERYTLKTVHTALMALGVDETRCTDLVTRHSGKPSARLAACVKELNNE